MIAKNKITCIVLSILIFILLVPQWSGRAGAGTALDVEAIDAFLSEKVSANRIPGLAAAVVQDGEVIFTRGYGEARAGVPVTPQTQFYIGSVTKSFTALAAMQLVEQGRLELDVPVQQYLPWFEVADEEVSSAITLRHLLNHTSGLNGKGDPNASAVSGSLEEQARLLQYVQPYAMPGSNYQYYNQNYRLVGLLIEQASGESYGDYLQQHVFDPLGMVNSTADPALAADLAQGHSRVFGFPLPREQRFVPGALPSGYIISTAEDMARFMLANLDNRQTDGEAMLDETLLAAMRTPPAGIESDYGMGWLVMDGGDTLVHGGSLENYQAFLYIDLKTRSGMVLLFNQNSMENMMFASNAIRDGMLELLAGETPQQRSYGWIGWLLLALAAADLFNHLRLLRQLPVWLHKVSRQRRAWLWSKVLLGILLPLFVIFALPWVIHALAGSSPSWAEPLGLMPDLTGWLLLGMSLDLLRSLLHAVMLLRQGKNTEVA